MLLSKGKIKLIHELFTLSYKPSLINTEDQKEQLTQLIEFQNSTNVLIPINPQYKTRTEELKKVVFLHTTQTQFLSKIITLTIKAHIFLYDVK